MLVRPLRGWDRITGPYRQTGYLEGGLSQEVRFGGPTRTLISADDSWSGCTRFGSSTWWTRTFGVSNFAMTSAACRPAWSPSSINVTLAKWAGDTDIDLVDQRQVLVALGVLDLIHSDGIDLSQNPVFEAPGDDVLDSIEDLLPGSTKGFGGFFPGQAARPAGQEQGLQIGSSVRGPIPLARWATNSTKRMI